MINSFVDFVLIKSKKKTKKTLVRDGFKPNLISYNSLFFSGRIPPGENLIITSIMLPIKTNLR